MQEKAMLRPRSAVPSSSTTVTAKASEENEENEQDKQKEAGNEKKKQKEVLICRNGYPLDPARFLDSHRTACHTPWRLKVNAIDR
jgi:hypothetical protein